MQQQQIYCQYISRVIKLSSITFGGQETGLSGTIWEYPGLTGTISDYLRLGCKQKQERASYCYFETFCVTYTDRQIDTCAGHRGGRAPKNSVNDYLCLDQ